MQTTPLNKTKKIQRANKQTNKHSSAHARTHARRRVSRWGWCASSPLPDVSVSCCRSRCLRRRICEVAPSARPQGRCAQECRGRARGSEASPVGECVTRRGRPGDRGRRRAQLHFLRPSWKVQANRRSRVCVSCGGAPASERKSAHRGFTCASQCADRPVSQPPVIMKKGPLHFLGRKNPSLFDTNVKMKEMGEWRACTRPLYRRLHGLVTLNTEAFNCLMVLGSDWQSRGVLSVTRTCLLLSRGNKQRDLFVIMIKETRLISVYRNNPVIWQRFTADPSGSSVY